MRALKRSRVVLPEKQVEARGDRLMATLGFDIVRLSQPRASMVTPGLPDRRYYHRARKIAVWFEAKREGGKQSFFQQDFQAMAEACGETYLVGTDDVLVAWCRQQGLIRQAII